MKSMKKDWYKKVWTMDIREVNMKEIPSDCTQYLKYRRFFQS